MSEKLPEYDVKIQRFIQGQVLTEHCISTDVRCAEGTFILTNENTHKVIMIPNNVTVLSLIMEMK